MKNRSLMLTLVLALSLLFGAAFKCSVDKTGSNSGSGDRGSRTSASGGLKPGEYACYGSGGQILIGLGFKVVSAIATRISIIRLQEHSPSMATR